MSCDNCGADTTNGLALCQACRAWFLVNCEFIPVYFRNLTRWRPSSASGVRRVPSSREPVMPGTAGTDRIGRVIDETYGDLARLTQELTTDRPQFERVITRIAAQDEDVTVRLTCALLVKHVDTLTTLPWVRDLLVGISEVERQLREETERAMPGWYAGACQLCGVPTHVVPGLTWVTCQGCGATTYARDHLEVVLKEAREWTARPKALAETLVALMDGEPSVDRLYGRIRKWDSLGWLTPTRRLDIDGDPVGAKVYCLGDVYDLATTRRAERMTTA